MAKEYIERKAVKRELLSWAVSLNHPEYLIKDDALHIIDSTPAADVVEVVRCRECKYHEDTHVTGFEHCCLYDLTMRYNDFCAYGKRKEVLTMAEYIENPLSGKLRGVTYENGKVTDVHIMDTDDVVKVFVPVRRGRWIDKGEYAVCTECGGRSGTQYDGVELIPLMTQFCPNCGCRMDGGAD